MSEQNLTTTENNTPATRRSPVAGIILIVIGAGLLLSQLFNLQGFFPLMLGLGFLVAGMVTRKSGLLIPGGIILGVGMGTQATLNNWMAPMGSQEQGGIFLLLFSLGWFIITLTSMIFTEETLVWPLIPGSVIGLIGGLILMGERGLAILEVIGVYWPVILVVIGILMLLGWWGKK